MAKPMNTDTLIASVKRRAMIPTSQSLFTDNDFIAFANEELDIGILPHILQYHEDYLMQIDYIPVTPQQSYYQIPSRASGNKLRMVNYTDPSGNVFEMTRVLIEDIPYYQNGSFGISNQGIRAFFVENDEVVMLPIDRHNLSGWLQFSYYLRPNELVATNQAATVTGFNLLTGLVNVSSIPSNLSSAIPMDIVQTKAPNKRLLLDSTPIIGTNSFKFGVSPIINITCTPAAQIPTGGYFSLIGNSQGLPYIYNPQQDDLQNNPFLNLNIVVWYDKTGSDSQPINTAGTQFLRVDISAAVTTADVVNATIAAINGGSLPYFSASPTPTTGGQLQILTTLTGIYGSVAIAPNTPFTQVTINNPITVIPDEIVIGDTVVAADTTIYPNVPTELHSMLAQRVACRCLEALGDQQGLAAANAKLAEMELKTGSLIDNRIEGAPLKVVNRHGFLRQSRRMLRR